MGGPGLLQLCGVPGLEQAQRISRVVAVAADHHQALQSAAAAHSEMLRPLLFGAALLLLLLPPAIRGCDPGVYFGNGSSTAEQGHNWPQ